MIIKKKNQGRYLNAGTGGSSAGRRTGKEALGVEITPVEGRKKSKKIKNIVDSRCSTKKKRDPSGGGVGEE